MKKESRRNPIARQVREPRFRKRVVKSKKVYTRKGRSIRPFHYDNDPALSVVSKSQACSP